MKNLKTFVQQLKNHYGTKVLFYSGNSYYYNYIKGYFPEDYFWLARYSSDAIPHDLGAKTVGWQFTNRMKIPGIKTSVDTNYFLRSSFEKLQVNPIKNKKQSLKVMPKKVELKNKSIDLKLLLPDTLSLNQ